MSIAEPRDLIEVLQRMEFWRQEPSVETKRAFKRFPVRGDATLEPIDAEQMFGPPLTVMLRDISRGGVGFLVEQYIEPRSVWRIAFKSQGQRIATQPIAVRFSRLVQDGLYLTGGQFVIEPFVMHSLGVSLHEMTDDINDLRDTTDGSDESPFVAPDDVTD